MNYKSTKKSVSFKAQARTIDHLGKGQIADAPTAISELWKNSYDAYARDVALHLFDGKIKCGAIIDNGCGMTYEQLSDSWLTIGTASKSKKQLLPKQDRFNLEDRFTQGEKGIGRLSTAFLAPVTLIVTKKINSRYSAALIDWRLFENTYLALHDIKVPMDEFDDINQLPTICSELQTEMLLNLALKPNKKKPEESIIRSAWENFTADELEAFKLNHNKNKDEAFISTEEKIKNLCKEFKFNIGYLDTWKELLSKVEDKDLDGEKHGTALFLIDLNRDLELMTNRGVLDRTAPEYIAIEKDLVDTLRGFVDPFERNNKSNFHYEIKSFSLENEKIIESKDILKYFDVFNSEEFSKLEHRVEGVIDNKGWFRGEIIAFGKSYENVAFPCRSLGMPLETLTGEFGVKLGTFELEKSKSSHTDTEVDFLTKQAEKHAGLMIFRDSLRVLPYGKADNDFFEIDDRRNKNAGRYHWATRRIFGHVSLHQNINKELKDKAGREGFIKNRVTREFKELMINLLLNSADKYFGSKSEDRQIMLSQLAKDKKRQKGAQRSTSKINLATFTNTLKNNEPKLNIQVEEIRELHHELESGIDLSLNSIDSIVNNVRKIEVLRNKLKVPNKPANIEDTLESQYRSYRDSFAELTELLQTCRGHLNKLEAKSNYSALESAQKKYNNSDAEINKIINRYTGLIENTLNNVHDFWIKESRLDKKSYNHQALPILDEITDSSDTEQVLNTLDIIYNNLSEDFTYKYEAFLKALDKLEKGIDIDSAFVIAEEERSKAEWEVNNIRRLAQLGISFEIVSHEIKAQEEAVTKALNSMNSEAKNHIGFKNAMRAHRQFIEYLRFLSPLKLSGYQSRDEITGTEISKYIHQFFSERAERQNISIEISNNFKRMVIVDVPSRIHPVFINIINNAMYWVGLSEVREIKIDVIDDLVVIANTGPEVDQDDIERLFELFYTRRSDGNGVGLYLSKQNLSVAHHKIWYALKSEEKLIKNGANFIIKFRGMELR